MSKECTGPSSSEQSEYGKRHTQEKATSKETVQDQEVIYDFRDKYTIMGSGNEPILVRFPEEPATEESTTKKHSKLTPKQADVLELLANGRQYKEAGEELHITARTVADYISKAKEELQKKSVIEVLIKAAQEGDIHVDLPPEFPRTLYTLPHKEYIVAQTIIHNPQASTWDIDEETHINRNTVKDAVKNLKNKFYARNKTNLTMRLILGVDKIKQLNEDSE